MSCAHARKQSHSTTDPPEHAHTHTHTQPSQVEIIATSTSGYLVEVEIQYMSNDNRDPSGLSGYDIYNAVPGDLHPMYIRNVSWELGNIGQSSPYPCASNTITTTLQPSVPIYKSCLSEFTVCSSPVICQCPRPASAPAHALFRRPTIKRKHTHTHTHTLAHGLARHFDAGRECHIDAYSCGFDPPDHSGVDAVRHPRGKAHLRIKPDGGRDVV